MDIISRAKTGNLIALSVKPKSNDEERIFWVGVTPDKVDYFMNLGKKGIRNAGFYSRRRNGFVYVMESEDGFIKVGSTNSVKTRLKMLNKKYRVELVGVIWCTYYPYLEKFIHYDLMKKGYEITREWYHTGNEVKEHIKEFVKQHGDIFGAYEYEDREEA